MNILLPWNLSYFIPLNGFHPLYRGVLGYSGEHRLIVPKHDLSYSQYQYLAKQGLYSNKIDDDLWWLKDLENDLKNKFYDFFSKREINFASYLAGDIEFLHTAPITKGERPFIVHLESFLPFFMPFSFQGESGIANTLLKVRDSYKKLLLKNCVAIVSHNKYTLKELSHFFNDPKIDELLKYIPIGVPYGPIDVITKPTKTTFLFVASAHQNINNFVYKGGMVAISSALRLLELDPNKYQFIFRTKRPPNEAFKPYGIDFEVLNKFEGDGTIIWLESNISEKSLKGLFAKSDYLFLASASLHSDAVLRAMMYGTIPIVTDIEPYEIYLDDKVSIKIKGVKNHIVKNEIKNNIKIHHDDYKLFPELHVDMVEQTISKISAISEKTRQDMSNKLIEKFQNNFQTEAMVEPLFNLFTEVDTSNNDIYKRKILVLGEDYIEDLNPMWFKTISQPYTLYRVGFGIMRKVFHSYLFFPSSQEHITGSLYAFSHINIIEHKYSKPINYRIETVENKYDIIQHLIHVINPTHINENRILELRDGNIAKEDCPYCNSNLKGMKKKYFQVKYKVIGYLAAFPILYKIISCGTNCLMKSLSDMKSKQVNRSRKIDPKIPTLLSSVDNYNIVKYQNKYYGIPHELGEVDIEHDDLSKLKDVLVNKRLGSLEKEIRTVKTTIDPKIPTLVSNVDNYNIVKYQNKYYGIPHELGEVDIEHDDLSKLKDILTNNRLSALEKEIIEKRTFTKILKINIRKLLSKAE